jgi:hypothetical protein
MSTAPAPLGFRPARTDRPVSSRCRSHFIVLHFGQAGRLVPTSIRTLGSAGPSCSGAAMLALPSSGGIKSWRPRTPERVRFGPGRSRDDHASWCPSFPSRPPPRPDAALMPYPPPPDHRAGRRRPYDRREAFPVVADYPPSALTGRTTQSDGCIRVRTGIS